MRILAADQSGMRRSRGSRGRILNIGNMPLIPHPSLPLPWKNFLGPRMSKSGCFWFMIWTNLRNKLEMRSAPRLWLNHSYTVVFLHSSSNKHTNCFVEMKFSASFFFLLKIKDTGIQNYSLDLPLTLKLDILAINC